ncbi:MAG: hypothetical protein IPG76_00145 [Acidobacteria bacterium]|nr:hypothetical protein [Acidobacteriota bacterium]
MDNDFDFDLQGFDELSSSPLRLPCLNSVYLSIQGLWLDLSAKSSIPPVAAAGFGSDFRGVYIQEVKVHFQDDLEGLPCLTANDFVIGTGGISGRIAADWNIGVNPGNKSFIDEKCDAKVKLFGNDGYEFALRRISIRLDKSIPTEFAIEGALKLPFFDSIVDVEMSIGEGGRILFGLRGIGPNGLLKLTKEGLFELEVDSLQFKRSAEEMGFTANGTFALLEPRLKERIPKFSVERLSVYRKSGNDQESGNHKWSLRLDGGSVEINKSINLFDVARADIKSIGFGKKDQGGIEWNTITISAGAEIAAISAGATVYGLRIPWRLDPSKPLGVDVGPLTLDGLGIKGKIPNTIAFDGYVKWGGAGAFEGSLAIHLIPCKIDIGAGLKIETRHTAVTRSLRRSRTGLRLAFRWDHFRCILPAPRD